MESAIGVIAVAQEARFLLARPDGRSQLMILAPGAGVEAQDLPGLVRSACSVRVAYEVLADRRAALAHRLEEAPVPPGGRP
jgi:hypothetical protein